MNLKRLIKILNLSPIEVLDYFAHECKRRGYPASVFEPNVYLFEKGSDIAFVAHVDTVFDKHPGVPKREGETLISPTPSCGLGADDRLGICAFLDLMDEHPFFRPSFFLCNFEEIGGLGARILNETFYYLNDFKCRALIELDRRGKKDAVFYHEPTPLFHKLVLDEGFVEQQGTFSDISFMNTNYSFMFAPSVNLSIGYINEHTSAERIILPWYEDALKRIFSLYVKLSTEKRDYCYTRKKLGEDFWF